MSRTALRTESKSYQTLGRYTLRQSHSEYRPRYSWSKGCPLGAVTPLPISCRGTLLPGVAAEGAWGIVPWRVFPPCKPSLLPARALYPTVAPASSPPGSREPQQGQGESGTCPALHQRWRARHTFSTSHRTALRWLCGCFEVTKRYALAHYHAPALRYSWHKGCSLLAIPLLDKEHNKHRCFAGGTIGRARGAKSKINRYVPRGFLLPPHPRWCITPMIYYVKYPSGESYISLLARYLLVACHLAPLRTAARREACPPPTPIYIWLLAYCLLVGSLRLTARGRYRPCASRYYHRPHCSLATRCCGSSCSLAASARPSVCPTLFGRGQPVRAHCPTHPRGWGAGVRAIPHSSAIASSRGSLWRRSRWSHLVALARPPVPHPLPV